MTEPTHTAQPTDPGSVVGPSGPRVLVVRSGANPFARLSPRTGVEIVERVSHTIQPLPVPPGAFERSVDFVVFTSQVTVERLLSDDALAPSVRRLIAGGRLVAVGPATEGALRRRGLFPDVVARGGAESVLERLPRRLEGQHVLHPCAEDATPELGEGLRRRGASVTRLPVYRKVPTPTDPTLAREIVARPFTAFCVTSPSAATWLFTGLPADAVQRLRRTPAVVLGPYTRRYLESHGVEHIAVTDEARFDAAAKMLEALAGGAPAQ
ncbi:MAG TPA: uroporphyrinogen-III synthase [Thermoanaerobaculia bacterium]|jgi:uroporphyrinogen III methyltransferase/synthase